MELCLSPDLGGLELYMQRCCSQLGPEVVAVVAQTGKLYPRLLDSGVETHTLKRRSRPLPLFAAKRLALLLDALEIDLLHIHWTNDIPLAALAKRFSSRPIRLISTRQMQITRPKKDLYHDFLYRQIDLHLAITAALARTMRQMLNPLLAERVKTLYYGVPSPENWLTSDERLQLRQELGLDSSTFVVSLVGRIKRYKGQHLLVEAIGRAIDAGEDVAAVMVGHAIEAEYLAQLRQEVVSRGWQQRILFQDFCDNPQGLMQACDCVVLTTVEETFGLVLIEAMRAGVAVVGSDRGGVPEIIEHEESGLLFCSGDSDDLYQQLQRLWRDPQWRQELARAGRVRGDRLFAEDLHFQELRNLLQQ
ncbi:MAG: glycosyltransferase family 4 protein [Gammaproteobacteria bacterium]|nr:glycosyltransferase family 4 protein [Gammaproteobacteria bacterium]